MAGTRGLLLAVILLGLLGAGVDLLLLGHFEGAWQRVPLALIVAGLVVLAWHAVRQSRSSLHALRLTMGLFVLSAFVGLVLHHRGSRAFQLEVNPSLHGRELFMKTVRAKTPPALGPGAMMQLGLIGLAYTYRHPIWRRHSLPPEQET